jgi:hypothetical protein
MPIKEIGFCLPKSYRKIAESVSENTAQCTV